MCETPAQEHNILSLIHLLGKPHIVGLSWWGLHTFQDSVVGGSKTKLPHVECLGKGSEERKTANNPLFEDKF